MTATEAIAIKQQVEDWRKEAKALHESDSDTHATVGAAESLTLERCAVGLECLLYRLVSEDLADRQRFGS